MLRAREHSLRVAKICVAAGCLLSSGPSQAASLGGLVSLPGQVLGGVGQTAGQLGSGLDTTLESVRRDLVGRPNVPRVFERDVNGARILRRTVIAISPAENDLAIARKLSFGIERSDNLPSLGLTIVELRTPGDLTTAQALAALRKADPGGSFDFDHIYDPSGNSNASVAGRGQAPVAALEAHSQRIGMIDGGISRHHPVFSDATLLTKNVAGTGEGPATAHGTAIASLLVGKDDEFQGSLLGAKLYAADVYGGQPGGGGAIEIARALDWLSENRIAVVNISLVGPANALLELSIRRFLAAGGIVVAAVGNAGPAAPLAYPAGYAGVVGVTSVDSQHRLQIDANRGDVTFAAMGVGVRAAKLDRGYATYTGTSFASPAVAARFAILVSEPDVHAAEHALVTLEADAMPIAGGRAAVGYGYLPRLGEAVATATK